MKTRIAIDSLALDAFCQRWKIQEFSLFGSVLRDDFGPDSDIDVLVSFHEDAEWSLWDHYHMQEELKELFGRDVDLLTRYAVEHSDNWIRRESILSTVETVYEQG